jgi:hypothetical protein
MEAIVIKTLKSSGMLMLHMCNNVSCYKEQAADFMLYV